MILKRFLSGRRKRTPPPDDQEGLIRIARGEEDAAARRSACRRIIRLSELRAIATTDLDAGIREIALAHYRSLLCGQESGPPLTERLGEISALDDQGILAQAASTALEAEIRRAALKRLTNATVLADCALNDALAANRCAAVERLEDKQALEHVVKNIGRKDKRVYRIARQKLKGIAECEALPERVRAQCEELCGKLERLGRFGNWVQDRAMLDLIDQQWVEISAEADTEWKTLRLELRGRFLRAYEDYRGKYAVQIAAEEARETLRARRRTLLEELATCATLSDEAGVQAGFEAISARWSAMETLPEKEQSALERKFRALSTKLSDRMEELATRRRRNERVVELLGKAEKALIQTKPLEHKGIRSLIGEAKPLLDAAGIDKAAATRFTEVRERIEDRLRKQKSHAEQRLEQVPDKLEELAASIERGELKRAEPLSQSLQASVDLAVLSGVPRKTFAAAGDRLRELSPRLRDLQKWRRWGIDQHRQELCRRMQQLAEADVPMEPMAQRLHDLQMEWKDLDKTGAPVNHPLWERFHTLSNQVYERCRPSLERQAAEREEHRRQREQLCLELEEFLDKVDWERMDWKRTAHAEREMRHAWAAIGPMEGRHRKALERRFRTALKRLDEHLREERARNQQLKHDLISRLETLVGEPDLDLAIEETKRLQREWHTTVPARQGEENRLWQRFRAAGDAVFARRREQHEAHAVELAENLKLREAICAEADSLAQANSEPAELMRALQVLDARWRESERLPVPRLALNGLNRRWREAREGLQHHHRERLEEEYRESVDLLARQAAACERLERMVAAGGAPPADPEVAELQWQALPPQGDPELQAAIEGRFKLAIRALRGDDEALDKLREALLSNGRRRAELCLRLEILARVDSPPELAQERLEFQVNRLKEHMREGDKDPLEGTSRLLREWYLGGPAPASEAAALEQRFQRVRNALEKAGHAREAP